MEHVHYETKVKIVMVNESTNINNTNNSTLYKNAGFSLDKSYAIFPQIL